MYAIQHYTGEYSMKIFTERKLYILENSLSPPIMRLYIFCIIINEMLPFVSVNELFMRFTSFKTTLSWLQISPFYIT